MIFERVIYQNLNARQKESYNFFKIASLLADYGFTSIRLSDDWKGADFIAVHINGETDLKVQLKGRLTLLKKYIGKNLYVCFPEDGFWYLYPHDELLNKILKETNIQNSKSWKEDGGYSFPYLSKQLREILSDYIVEQ